MGLEPGTTSFHAEMLVQQRAVQTLDDAVGLRALDQGGAGHDLLELQAKLVGRWSGRPQSSPPGRARLLRSRARATEVKQVITISAQSEQA
jgi:hypothetical protein